MEGVTVTRRSSGVCCLFHRQLLTAGCSVPKYLRSSLCLTSFEFYFMRDVEELE